MPAATLTSDALGPARIAGAGLSFGRSKAITPKMKRRELTFVLRNLATLIDNGLALPKALSTLARERALRKHSSMLDALRRKIETGETFSAALAGFPKIFNDVLVNQVRVGEKSGTLPAALGRIATQLEKSDQIRSQVTKKLAYPALLLVAGSAAVTFMLLFVVPIFEQTYAESKVPLPWITQALVEVGHFMKSVGWLFPLLIVAAVVTLKQMRSRKSSALAMDFALLRIPGIGPWLRDLSVLEFMDVFGNLLESGFNVVDALDVSAGSVRNRAVRGSIEQLQSAVTRGERFSRELDRQGDLFPPVVGQLVIIGEKTGNLAKATSHIREHLRREIERTTNILVGTIEPVLTISLAVVIGGILLAIYLPMFDMIGAMKS